MSANVLILSDVEVDIASTILVIDGYIRMIYPKYIAPEINQLIYTFYEVDIIIPDFWRKKTDHNHKTYYINTRSNAWYRIDDIKFPWNRIKRTKIPSDEKALILSSK